MANRVLITGGAGFVGSHLADELLAAGYEVRALDNLTAQVHGARRHATGERPGYLDPAVELQVGDVRDRRAVDRALAGVDAVVHLAAAVGVGQSMYQVAEYLDVNAVGTGVLLEALADRRGAIERLVVASSMSVYGEGLYRRGPEPRAPVAEGARRDPAQLRLGQWEVRDADGRPLVPAPTPESKPVCLESVYALSKHDQERLALLLGASYAIPAVALRFFNIYGPRQALGNPYTGVLAIFAARLLHGRPPLVYEDGLQRRDFVHVRDVARACRLALTDPAAIGEVLNVGSGEPRTIRSVAHELAAALGKAQIQPELTGEFRLGDVRHCYADLGRARALLGYAPEIDFADGLVELAGWLERAIDGAAGSDGLADRVVEARRELSLRGLAS